MNPSAWIALSSLAAVIFVQSAIVAFAMGRLFQRVSTVERNSDAITDMKSELAGMRSDLHHVSKSLDELRGQLTWATDVAPAGRQRRKPGEAA